MAKRPLPKASSGGKDVLMVNQLTVRKSVQFPELQAAVETATGNGGGKNGKDKTLTKEEFDSGFQDGVGQIKEGFAGLGAGLGPLQVVVDFVKGIGSKIGSLFTIFKGLFNIIMSIPKAIGEAFRKKDKEDEKKNKDDKKEDEKKDKKDKKDRDKKHKEGLKESAKGRKGFRGFLSLLQPILIVGAIVAIAAGLVKLYNWLAEKGLFEYFEKLGEQISFQLNRLRMTFTRFFGDGEESEYFRQLQAENANIQAGRILKDGFSEEEQAKLDRQQNKADKTIALIEILENRGVAADQLDEQRRVLQELVTNQYNFTEGIFRENRETNETFVREALGGDPATKKEIEDREEEIGTALEFNMEDYNALYSGDQLGFKIDPNSKILDPKFEVDFRLFKGLTKSMDEGEYAQRKLTGPDGELLTIDRIVEDFNNKYAYLGDKFTPKTVEQVAREINQASDYMVLSDNTIVRIDEKDDLGQGFIKVRENEAGDLVQDTSQAENDAFMAMALTTGPMAAGGGAPGPFMMMDIYDMLYEDEKEIEERLIKQLIKQDGILDTKEISEELEQKKEKRRFEGLRQELLKDGELDDEDKRLLDLLGIFKENEQNVDNFSRNIRGRFRYENLGGLPEELQVSGDDTTSFEVTDALIESIRESLGPDVTTGEAADVYNTFMNNETFAHTTVNTAVEYGTQDTSLSQKDIATFYRMEQQLGL